MLRLRATWSARRTLHVPLQRFLTACTTRLHRLRTARGLAALVKEAGRWNGCSLAGWRVGQCDCFRSRRSGRGVGGGEIGVTGGVEDAVAEEEEVGGSFNSKGGKV